MSESSPLSTRELPAGTLMGHYSLGRKLGEGGMGMVYVAQDTRLGRTVALKVLHANISSDPDRRYRFLREGRLAAGLTHPCIAAVYEVGEADERLFIAMELVEGRSVGALLEESGGAGLRLFQALRITREVVRGLVKAHESGIVHRDLKPENVMYGEDQVVKILDFGVAKRTEEASSEVTLHATKDGSIVGTPAYMSPEQFRDSKDVDQRTDVYALGVIFYEMVTRDRPFAADDFVQLFMQVQQGEFRPPRELNPAITPGMEAAILGAMAVDPAQRIPDCETMLAVWRGKSTFNAAAQVPADRTGPWDMALVRRAAGLNAMESAPIRLTDPGPPPPAPREPPSVVSITESPPRVNRSVVLAVVLASGAAVLVVGGILAIAAFFGVTQLLPRKPEAVAVEVPAPVVAPEPVVAAPEPVVVAPEPVVPVPQPTRVAAPVAPVARMGRLKMTGDATNVWLVGGGRRWPPGDVPEGVYAVEAEFPSKGIQEVPLKATVVRDRETVVDCRSGFYTCTAR